MREILFQGKRKDTGGWVEGCLFIDDKGEKHEILVGYVNYRISWEVDPATVGQFTGQTDKNGKKIFEGDIVRCIRSGLDRKEMVGQIVYGDCCFCVKEQKGANRPAMDLCVDYEVIGNIYDNPLLDVHTSKPVIGKRW